MTALLEVDHLSVRFAEGGADALRDVSLRVELGETVAVVGETGAGKSTLALAIAGLVHPPDAVGSVRFDGQELLGATPDALRGIRWQRIAIALQGAPFNPVMRVGDQIAEPVTQVTGASRASARGLAQRVADEFHVDRALLDRYPHQLSGGQRCSASLAMAMVLDPELVILDEPTQGLDAALAVEMMEAIDAAVRRRGAALVVITHDLSLASRLTDRTMVLYAGAVAEQGTTAKVLGSPRHPYTYALVNAYPVMTTTKDLRPIRGRPADSRAIPSGCAFHPRCTQAADICRREIPELRDSAGREVACHFGGVKTLLEARGLEKAFQEEKRTVVALQNASLTLREGEAVGVIGASGSGKTTLARIIAGHLAADQGELSLEDAPIDVTRRGSRHPRAIQLVMQDPWDALSPRLTVAELVREPLDIDGTLPRGERDDLVAGALSSVGLPPAGTFLGSRAHQLSGGQLQRVALARALVLAPKVLVADEPTSMLDPSEQARLLVVLRERQVEMGLGLLLISHDMALVRKVCDRIAVIDRGQVVEEGASNVVSTAPHSEAGRRLIHSAPTLAPGGEEQGRESGTGGGEDEQRLGAADRPAEVSAVQRGGGDGGGAGIVRASTVLDPGGAAAHHPAPD
ncbi:MAG TPA: ABC transporter ATP-binding protein [Candidatus Dormibacteraeota bacterium]